MPTLVRHAINRKTADLFLQLIYLLASSSTCLNPDSIRQLNIRKLRRDWLNGVQAPKIRVKQPAVVRNVGINCLVYLMLDLPLKKYLVAR